jgi:hypothetical protein
MASMGMVMGRIRLTVVFMVMAMVRIKARVRVKAKGKAMTMAMATVESRKSGCSSRLVLAGRRLDRQNVSLRCIGGWEAGRFQWLTGRQT